MPLRYSTVKVRYNKNSRPYVITRGVRIFIDEFLPMYHSINHKGKEVYPQSVCSIATNAFSWNIYLMGMDYGINGYATILA